MISPSTILAGTDWLAPALVKPLSRLGLLTVGDILTHYPKRHEDRTRFDQFPQNELPAPICIRGVVEKTSLKRFGGYKKMFDATLADPSGHALSNPIVLRWFNLHYVQHMIAIGQTIIAYGRPRLRGRILTIEHPEFEVVEEDSDASLNVDRITPIYPATEGITQRAFRKLIHSLLCHLETVPDLLPEKLRTTDQRTALQQIHFPDDHDRLEAARRQLVLTEFFGLQLQVAQRRAHTVALPGASHCGTGKLLARLLASLPYALTKAQERVIAEIRRDLASSSPMNRLLQGDVGSGKTLVALSAMLLAVEAGFQCALMAPTQILAEQHYLNFTRLLAPLGLRLALRTGNRREELASLPLFEPETPGNPDHLSSPQILIGTHALLYDSVEFADLGLVVIDEQHKFGVLQRARLISRRPTPDVLVMTATPIPRTLTMTAYGDLDVSILDELPPGRGRILTELRPDGTLKDPVKFKDYLAAGHQAYVVCPLIDDSEKTDAKAATAELKKWSAFLSPLRCEVLHGRVPPAEKEAVMRRFRDNQIQVLIATTVIEVGIDVPNATVMIIEDAEKFGLAQLHQLRGRVGRGSKTSYCILLTRSKEEFALQKLRALADTTDGFAIAEADLELRGPGDILGTAQSGLAPLKIGNILRDPDLMLQAREAASAIVLADPDLSSPPNLPYRSLLAQSTHQTLSHVS